ncbi:MAG: TIGR03768 family metallophosphoesterase [Terracidiphilus sp.]
MAIDEPIEQIEPTCINSISRRKFIEISCGTAAFVSLSSMISGCGGRSESEAGYPISSEVYTTRQRAIAPKAITSVPGTISPWDSAHFQENGYGLWSYIPGIDFGKDLRIMPSGYDASSVKNAASLLSFFTLTDTHIYDKESPSQPFYLLMRDMKYPFNSLAGITFTMLYTTHILDAAIQTVNALHKQKPFDCGLFLGDACNNSQYNELRWYIDVIDGKFITPSSGDHAGAETIDYQKPYQAAGLDKTIPWYQIKGSHENFWFGGSPVIDKLQQNYIGGDILCVGDVLADASAAVFNEQTYCMGTVDGSTPYGKIIGAGPVDPTNVINVAADPDRRSLNMKDWMTEFFNTSSSPSGHGFTQSNIDKDLSSYSFEPKSNIPLKIIMLDNTQSEQSEQLDPSLAAYGNGSLDLARYNWLLNELEEGQSEGKLMIIAAHVPIGVEPYDSGNPGSHSVTGCWGPDSDINDSTQLIPMLLKYPNLILWLAGHQHNNQVTPFVSPHPDEPELGFWEVQTASLRDFPQQFRTIDIVRNTDNTISIIITNVDPAVSDGSPAAMSRFYAIAATELYNTPTTPSADTSADTSAYNAELIIQLSPEMQTKIQQYGISIRK